MGQNFTDAMGKAATGNVAEIEATGKYYAEVLTDLDTLLATDTALSVGPWLEMAKR